MRVSKSARHPIGDIEQWNWLDHFVVSVGHRCQPDRKPGATCGQPGHDTAVVACMAAEINQLSERSEPTISRKIVAGQPY